MVQLPTPELDLTANFTAVNRSVELACRRAGRRPEDVTVVAVTKSHPSVVTRKARALGIHHFGENKVQEAVEKYSNSGIHEDFPDIRLHLVGHLQRNKVRRALQTFDNIDAVDTVDLARSLDLMAGSMGKIVRILVEVNTSGEPQKFGADPGSVMHLASMASGGRNLQLAGLMTVGPNTDDRPQIRRSFRLLKELFDDIGRRLSPQNWSVLSMGMSGDYEIAIEEGATEIRLGTALFGPREVSP